MKKSACRGRLSAALLTFAFAVPLAVAAHAQSGAAKVAWDQFSAANADWTADWSATGDQVESLRGMSAPAAGDAAKIAERFISANAAMLGLPNGLSDLKLAYRISEGGDTHLQYQQSYGGLQVFNGFVDVHLNGQGQVYLVHNSSVPGANVRTQSQQPSLSPAAAVAAARALTHRFFDKSGAPFNLALSPVARPELGIQKTDGGSRLAYRVDFGPAAYIVDANSAAVLDTILYMQSVRGTGTIFDPNPVNTLNNATLRDQNDANYPRLRGAYFTDKLLLDITKTGTGASARFWLVGPYARTLDLRRSSVGTCMNGQSEVRKAPGPSRNGKFPVVRSNSNFEHVMAYFHLDRSQRYIRSIGINNWRASIRVDGHAITVDNSFYCGRPVGRGYLAFGDGGVDDAEDADVIIHEYGHALQDNASNGRYLAGGQTGAMGEGFGDYWSYSAKTSGRFADCFAEWDGQGTCLRRLDKNKKYPQNYVGEVHADGEIWSRGLRDVLLAVGKAKADKIILKSHFLVPRNPTFSKGLQALLNADRVLYRSANKEKICSAFIDRGISAPDCGYWIRMTWNKLGADVDLSFIPPPPLQTVYYGNRHPNWGDQSTDEDDPTLYEDCISTCTSEEITVSRLVTRGTYKVRAHYYSDHGKGAASVHIEVFRGATRRFAGTRTLARTGAEWLPFNIVVPPGKAEPEIVWVDELRTLRPSALPKK